MLLLKFLNLLFIFLVILTILACPFILVRAFKIALARRREEEEREQNEELHSDFIHKEGEIDKSGNFSQQYQESLNTSPLKTVSASPTYGAQESEKTGIMKKLNDLTLDIAEKIIDTFKK